MRRHLTLCVVLAIPLSCGCADSTSHPSGGRKITGDEVRKKLGEAAEAVGQYASQQKDEFVRDMQRRLGQMDESIADLQKRLAQAKEDAKPVLRQKPDE